MTNLAPDLRTVLLEQNAIDMMVWITNFKILIYLLLKHLNQLLRVAFRFCFERDSFVFPPGAEVTLPCLSATQIGGLTASRLAALGTSREIQANLNN